MMILPLFLPKLLLLVVPRTVCSDQPIPDREERLTEGPTISQPAGSRGTKAAHGWLPPALRNSSEMPTLIHSFLLGPKPRLGAAPQGCAWAWTWWQGAGRLRTCPPFPWPRCLLSWLVMCDLSLPRVNYFPASSWPSANISWRGSPLSSTSGS